MPPSTIILDNIVAVLRRSPVSVTTSSQSPRRRADETLPQSSAGSEFEGRHRAERVLKLGGAVVSVLDLSGREDVRLHQPNAFVVNLQRVRRSHSPLVAMHHHDLACA